MAEVAAVHVTSRVMKLGHRCSHGSRHARSNDQGDEFDDRKKDCDSDQEVNNTSHEFAKRRKQVSIEDGRTRGDLQNCQNLLRCTGLPVQHRKWSAKGDFTVETAGRFRYSTDRKPGR